MEAVSVSRAFDVPPTRVREALHDVEAVFEAAGFDVSRDGDDLHLSKRVAVKRVELHVRLVDDDAALAYEQVEGIFEAMRTQYVVDETVDGCSVTVETEFEPPSSGFGTFVNGALVKRMRRTELADLESLVEGTAIDDRPTEEGRTANAGSD